MPPQKIALMAVWGITAHNILDVLNTTGLSASEGVLIEASLLEFFRESSLLEC